MKNSDDRHGRPTSLDGPTHPWLRATLLMVGVVVLLVALSVSTAMR
jgi:hypothetical protein